MVVYRQRAYSNLIYRGFQKWGYPIAGWLISRKSENGWFRGTPYDFGKLHIILQGLWLWFNRHVHLLGRPSPPWSSLRHVTFASWLGSSANDFFYQLKGHDLTVFLWPWSQQMKNTYCDTTIFMGVINPKTEGLLEDRMENLHEEV